MHAAALISFKKGAHAILRMRQTGVLKRQNRKIGNAQKNCTDGVIFSAIAKRSVKILQYLIGCQLP